MKILFAPSEAKISLKNIAKNNAFSDIFSKNFSLSNLCFNDFENSSDLKKAREIIFKKYCEILQNGNKEEIAKISGLKNFIESDFIDLDSMKNLNIEKIAKSFACEAIIRYCGVAYSALNFNNLSQNAKEYLRQNLFIFSNLFGVLKADDLIINYKLKQGELLGEIDSAKLYKKALKEPLDFALKDCEILDLRAGFYDKFYIPNKEFSTFLFIKNGKAVSHFAKFYRGIILRECAIRAAKSVDELLSEPIQNLYLSEIKQIKNKKIYVCEIKE